MELSNKIFIKLLTDRRAKKSHFKIVEQPQKYRNTDAWGVLNIFVPDDYSKYCIIKSVSCPQAGEYDNTFYLRGEMQSRDNKECHCSWKFFDKIQRTLKKVNEKNKLLY